jgi:hypothetical protein
VEAPPLRDRRVDKDWISVLGGEEDEDLVAEER